MNNKKYLLDLSLEIEASDITATGKPNILITKEINGQKIILDLPVVEELTAQGFIDDEIYDHYRNAQSTEKYQGTGGFWLREKNIDIATGLQLVVDKTEQYFLPH